MAKKKANQDDHQEAILGKIQAGERLSPTEAKAFEVLKADAGLSGTVPTMGAAAKILGVSRRTLCHWKKMPGFPVEPDGSYDPDKIAVWRGLDIGSGDPKQADAENQSTVSEKVFWDVEFRRWRAKLSEIAFLRETGELIPRADVEGLLVDRATEFKKALMGRARRLSLRIAGKDAKICQALLEEDALQILEVYSRPNHLLRQGKVNASGNGK